MADISKEEFEKHFKEVNASWAIEGAELSEAEKELVFKRLNGQITVAEFNKAVMEAGKK